MKWSVLVKMVWAISVLAFSFSFWYREHDVLLHLSEVTGMSLLGTTFLLNGMIGLGMCAGICPFLGIIGAKSFSALWILLMVVDLSASVAMNAVSTPLFFIPEPQLTDLFQLLLFVGPLILFVLMWTSISRASSWKVGHWAVILCLLFAPLLIPYQSLELSGDSELEGATLVLSSSCGHCDEVYRDVSILNSGRAISPIVILATDSAMIESFTKRNENIPVLPIHWDNKFLELTGNKFPALLLSNGKVIAGNQITLGTIEKWLLLNR